jgi:hypothetical protein
MLLLGPGKLRIFFTLPAVQYFMHCARFWHLVLCLLQEMSNRSLRLIVSRGNGKEISENRFHNLACCPHVPCYPGNHLDLQSLDKRISTLKNTTV